MTTPTKIEICTNGFLGEQRVSLNVDNVDAIFINSRKVWPIEPSVEFNNDDVQRLIKQNCLLTVESICEWLCVTWSPAVAAHVRVHYFQPGEPGAELKP